MNPPMYEITSEYLDRIIENCKRARKATPTKAFNFQSPLIVDVLSRLSGVQSAVYIIEEIEGNSEQTFKRFETYKAKRLRACPRINQPSPILYVGSSTTGIRRRIREHIGLGSASTSALNLQHWFQGQYSITVLEYDEPIHVLQLIEDSIYQSLGPAFGKPGSNNKRSRINKAIPKFQVR